MYKKVKAEVESKFGPVETEIVRGVFKFYSISTGALVAEYSEKKGLIIR